MLSYMDLGTSLVASFRHKVVDIGASRRIIPRNLLARLRLAERPPQHRSSHLCNFRTEKQRRCGTTKVVVTSDHHLGYANADKAAFNAFLDNLTQEDDLTHMVLLGDVVDMWRRDASGVFLEGHDTIGKILALQSKGVQVFYVLEIMTIMS